MTHDVWPISLALLAAAPFVHADQPANSEDFSYRTETIAFPVEGVPFLKIRWRISPSATELAKFFPSRVRGWSFVNVVCARIDNQGLHDCRVSQSDPEDPELAAAALKAAAAFRHPVELPSNVRDVVVAFWFRNGTGPEIRCLPPFCTATLRPPPNPAPSAQKDGAAPRP